MKPTDAELEKRMLYTKCNTDATARIKIVTATMLEAAKQITRLVPDCRELSQALTDLDNARMHANQGIACNQDRL